jgi:archaellum biogenesis ATPase FlaH
MPAVKTITLSTVRRRSISWLWQPYIPLGALTVLLGNGGQGKSFLSLAIAAAVTTGQALPGNDTALPPSDVIVQNTENAIDTVIGRRLDILGADCGRVHCIDTADEPLTLTDERIEAAIVQHNARLMIIDPLQAHLGSSVSMNRAESVRPAFTRLSQVAERTNSAILLVGHLSKSRTAAQYRGLGSVDIVNAVPSVLYLGVTDRENSIRAVVHGKSNFDELGASQSFRLNKERGFEWLGECGATVEDVTSGSVGAARMSKIEFAAEFLREALSENSLSAVELAELAADNGISAATLKRAKDTVGVRAERVDGHWVSSLEDQG